MEGDIHPNLQMTVSLSFSESHFLVSLLRALQNFLMFLLFSILQTSAPILPHPRQGSVGCHLNPMSRKGMRSHYYCQAGPTPSISPHPYPT